MNAISTPAELAGRAGRREWIGLAVLTLPAMLISMDLTVLHLAVPSISAELKPTSAQLLWIIDIYGFMVAGSLITMGTLGDRIGRRKLLLYGASAFAVASVLAAFSTSAEMLIVTRAILGVAGATLMPSTMSLIRIMFNNAAQRTAALGFWISSFSVGAAIGPLVGGLLLDYFWWGSAFLVALPVMTMLLALGPVLLPEYRDPTAGRLDLFSAGLSLSSVLAVIYGVKQIAAHGLSGLPIVCIAAGIAAGALFVQRQRTLADPLVDTRLFANRAFVASLVTNMAAIFAIFGVFLFIPQYYQLVVGLSPFEAGIWSLPGALTSIAGSMLAPVIVRNRRPGPIVCIGLVAVTAAFALLTQASVASLVIVVGACVIMMFAFSVVITLTSDLIISAAPPERAGAASALSETTIELGGALGIAILGSIGTAVYRQQVAGSMPDGLPSDAATSALDTLGGAVGAAGQLSDQLGGALLLASRLAFVDGLHLVSICGAIIILAIAIMAAFWLGGLPAAAGAEPHGAPAPAAEFEPACAG
jgi:DHA2 family multidrug resistance protein-like MFS transporter